jgi:hypothetical protein
MATLKNISRGPRTFQVFDDNDNVRTTILQPGQEADLNLVDENDPVVQGMISNKEVVIDGDDEAGSEEARFASDPKFLLDRKLAEAAGSQYAEDPREVAKRHGHDEEGHAEAHRIRMETDAAGQEVTDPNLVNNERAKADGEGEAPDGETPEERQARRQEEREARQAEHKQREAAKEEERQKRNAEKKAEREARAAGKKKKG